MMEVTANAWPESFIYICSAGKAQVVNAGPLRNAGLGRVERVIVLCGAAAPQKADANTRANAIDPKNRLVTWLEANGGHRLSEGNGTIEVIYGDPFDLQHWCNALAHRLSFIGARSSAIFNVKGGTKEMSVGAMMAVGSRERSSIISPRAYPHRVERIDLGRPGVMAAGGGYLSMQEYVGLYGFTLGSNTKEATYRAEAGWINKFCGIVEKNVYGVARMLNRLIKQFPEFRPERFQPLHFDAGWGGNSAWHLAKEGFHVLEGHFGFEVERDAAGRSVRYTIGTYEAAEFLRGGWLEAQLFLALDVALAGRGDIELRANPTLFPTTAQTRLPRSMSPSWFGASCTFWRRRPRALPP